MHRNGRLLIVIVIIIAGAGFAYYQKRQNTLRCQKPHSINSENLKRRPYTKGGVEQQRINRQEHREGARGAAHAGQATTIPHEPRPQNGCLRTSGSPPSWVLSRTRLAGPVDACARTCASVGVAAPDVSITLPAIRSPRRKPPRWSLVQFASHRQ
jgi:hypothetical protein